MILIGMGSNLTGGGFGDPRQVLEAALTRLGEIGVRVVARSRFYESAPVPASDQPWFVNAVVAVDTAEGPDGLLALLHRVEAEFGRVRRVVNEARVLDLDLLDFRGQVRAAGPVLPHPRMDLRAFVLLPLRDVAPDWHHPVSGEGLETLIARLDPAQVTRPLA